MADERFNRWQGQGIAQMTVAIAFVSGLSAAELAFTVALVRDAKFVFGGVKPGLVLICLLAAVALSFLAVISRLLDFKLTARVVRKNSHPTYKKALTFFGLGPDGFGCATWACFILSGLTFIAGSIMLISAVAIAYADRLF